LPLQPRPLRRHNRSRLPVTLDGQHRVSGVYLVGKRGCTGALVDPREVYKAALLSNSPAYVLVHNHPSGVVRPSSEDLQLAGRLEDGGRLLNVNMVASIIVGEGGSTATAKRRR
jgi:DNA repair protein RadC